MTENQEVQNAEPIKEAEVIQPEAQEEVDEWTDAKEAFEEPEEPKSHLEQEPKQEVQVDPLELLHIPHKYKPVVKQHLDAQLKEREAKFEEVNKNLTEQKDAVQAAANVLKEVAENPKKLIEYVTQYGSQFGISQDVIDNYKRMTFEPQQQVQKPQRSFYDEAFERYAPKMMEAKDAGEFVSSLKSVISEVSNHSKEESIQTAIEMVKHILGGYHNKFVEPNLSKIRKSEETAEHSARVNTWQESKNRVTEKLKDYGDFDKYESKILDRMTKDPRVKLLNSSPEDAAREDITHDNLIEEAYFLVSRQDHLENAKKKQTWAGSIKPVSKQVNTKRQSAVDWDSIQAEDWPETLD